MLAAAPAEAFSPLIEGSWRGALEEGSGPFTVEFLSRGAHQDSAAVYLVRGGGGAPRAVIQCSMPVAPGLVERSMHRTRLARAALHGSQADRVLVPLAEGVVDGLSCAMLPWCEALEGNRMARWLQTRRLRAPALAWLRDVAGLTLRPAALERIAPALEAMQSDKRLGHTLRQAAEVALSAAAAGQWQPVHVLMHGDLWRGNWMLHGGAGGWSERLVVIDWAGSRLDGWPFFDLLRLCDSIGVGGERLGSEIRRHAALAGCAPAHARLCVTAALADTLAALEHFPVERFVQMAERALARLDAAS